MAQYDYNKPASQAQEKQLPKFEKIDDVSLPHFSKEVPLRTIVKKHRGNVTIEYEWSMFGGEEIKINFACMKDDDNLQYVHKIRIKDGEEAGSFKVANTTYLIRKTSEDVAKGLMKTSGKIKASILGVIGYFKTVKGNCYTVSKVDSDAWALDQKLGLKTFSLDAMDSAEKRKLSDLVMDEVIKLCRQGYSLAAFGIGDVIITKKKVVLANTPAIMKAGRGDRIGNFMQTLRAMFKTGISQREDVVYGIALFLGVMKNGYAKWAEQNGISAEDDVQLLEKMEAEILS